MEFNPDFRDLFCELNAGRVEYLIVGGYAVIYHAEPRYTKDIDTLQAEAMIYFYPERYTGEPHRAALQAVVVDRLAEMFARVDPVLAGHPYLLGDAFSAADIYLFMLSRWTRNMPRKARELPHLGAFLARVMARPAVREAYAIERIAEPYY